MLCEECGFEGKLLLIFQNPIQKVPSQGRLPGLSHRCGLGIFSYHVTLLHESTLCSGLGLFFVQISRPGVTGGNAWV